MVKSILVDDEIHQKLKMYCVRNNVVMKDMVEEMIRDGIKSK